jgi:hypothetical protein
MGHIGQKFKFRHIEGESISFEETGRLDILTVRDFVEVQTQNGAIILKPKRIVDAEQDKNNATPSTVR